MSKEFEKWAELESLNLVQYGFAKKGYEYRQAEIDALIHDNDAMRKAIVEYEHENAALKAEIKKFLKYMDTNEPVYPEEFETVLTNFRTAMEKK